MEPRFALKPVFTTEDRVRYMLKKALGKDPFYKSYEGMRTKAHGMWSKKIFGIKDKRNRSGEIIYKVNGKWRPAYELQLIEGPTIQLSKPKTQGAKKPLLKRKLNPAPKHEPRVPKSVIRRSTRARRAPVRFGYTNSYVY